MNASGPDSGQRPSLWGAILRGCFPHQLSWLIDNPVRRLFISPGALADRLPLLQDSRILEVGPGSGYFSRELAARVPEGRLELLDVQPEMLVKAVRKFGETTPSNLGWTRAEASQALPFAADSFDIVVLVAVLGELPSPEEGLKSLFRVLRPGGVVAVHEHMPDPDIVWPERLRGLMAAQGFRFLKQRGRAWNYTALFEKPAPR